MIIRIIYIFILLSCPATSIYSQHIEAYAKDSFYTIHARATNKNTGEPVKGERCYLTIPGAYFTTLADISDSIGDLKFLLKEPVPNTMLIFSPEQPDVKIQKDNPFSSYFDIQRLEETVKSDFDSLPFYGTPDKKYLLDDYTRFFSMEEIIIEYVPEIKLKKQKNILRFEVLNLPVKTFFDRDPLVLLDGLPVFDISQLKAIDPLNIRKLEVVCRKYYYGQMVYNGIVSFTTYDGKMGGYQLPANVLVTEFGIQ